MILKSCPREAGGTVSCLQWTRILWAHVAAVLTSEGTDEDQTTSPRAGPARKDSGQTAVSFQKPPRQEEGSRNTCSASLGDETRPAGSEPV